MAASDYILKIESVRGETRRRDGDDDLIEVLTFEFGASSSHFQGGPTTKHRAYSNMRFTKLLDKSSTTIQQLLSTNAQIRQATLTARKAGGEQHLIYYKVVLRDAYVVSYKVRGEDLPDEYRSMPRDEFELSFTKIDVEYTEQTQRGTRGVTKNFSDDVRSNE